MPPDERSRRLGQPAAPAEPVTTTTRITDSIADRGDGAGPHAIGDLFSTWFGIQIDTVDDLIGEARDKAAAIPDQRQLWALFGEALVRLHCLEVEVAGLRVEVGRLRQRGRVA